MQYPMHKRHSRFARPSDPGLVVGTDSLLGRLLFPEQHRLRRRINQWQTVDGDAGAGFQPIVQEIMLHVLSQRNRERTMQVGQSFLDRTRN